MSGKQRTKTLTKSASRSASPKVQPPRSSSSTTIPTKKPAPTFLSTSKKKSTDSKNEILDDPVVSSETPIANNLIIKHPYRRRDVYDKGIITGIHFKIATTEEIRGVDRCKLVDSKVSTTTGAVCDSRMGATLDTDCSTCGKKDGCSGHPGYIELAWPIINPVFMKNVLKILKLFCFRHFKEYRELQIKEIAKIRQLIRDGKLSFGDGSRKPKMADFEKMAAANLAKMENPPVKILPCFDPEQPERDYPDSYGSWRLQLIVGSMGCKKCVTDKEQVHYIEKREFYIEERIGDSDSENVMLVDPRDILKFFTAIDEDETRNWSKILGFGENKLASMINVVWPVLSNVDRLDTITPERELQNPLSKLYSDMVKYNNMLGSMLSSASVDYSSQAKNDVTDEFNGMLGMTYVDKTKAVKTEKAKASITGVEIYNSLNTAIKSFIYDKEDSAKEGQRRALQVMSVTIIVNGKPGIIRKHIMGKGSDHSGRTVIIGDNNIDIDEIGITRVFSDSLTIPEVLHNESDVAKWTAEMPRIVGGKSVMGTIVKVIKSNRVKGITITPDSNIELRVGDVVRRKLINGDIVVVTRQPVLHKGGLLGFRIRIFEEGGNVLRLHPAVAGSFNADFDGDEMNFTIPQEPDARADVLHKLMVGNCIRGDKYSTPWTGMIQNPVIAAVQITQPGVIIERNLAKRLIDIGLETFRRRNPGGVFRTDTKDYYDYLYTLNHNIDPFSGRALVSFFMPTTFSYERRKGKDKEPVIVEHGFLLSGVMDKGDIGKASNGMVDNMLTTYGAETVIVFVSALNRALYEFISADGFSIGIRDCILPNLSDGTNPQDTIDALIKDTAQQVVELLEEGRKISYLGQQAEAKADKLLSELSDRINGIVISGGVDVVTLQGKLSNEKNDSAFKNILDFLLSLSDIKFNLNEPSTANLVEAEILDTTDESIRKLTKHMHQRIHSGRNSKTKNADYNEEMHLLTIWAYVIEQMEPIDYSFDDIILAMKEPDDINGFIIKMLKDAADIRSQLVGASKFNNRLLTTVYSGAKGSTSNVLQAMGLVGPQEKSFIGRDATLQRSLPFHKEGELNPLATHFCGSSYAKGLDPLETWNHASASRANIITSNMKPPETGWFYRRAICLAIDIYTLADGSSRDEKNRIVQFMYGGDGCDAVQLINVSKKTPPQFINMSAAVKNLRTENNLSEFELK
jgi:DNA-directed RNA polymerase beta' subunit